MSAFFVVSLQKIYETNKHKSKKYFNVSIKCCIFAQ